jgi:CHAD domain-containing protein
VLRIESRFVDGAADDPSAVAEGGDVLDDLEQTARARPGLDATSVDGVLATPSPSLERSYATPQELLSDVLGQFSRNFLLNDLSLEESHKLLERAKPTVLLAIPRREPRRRDSTIEQVHQARVSIRRLRSTLRTFSGTFTPEWLSPLATELSWYASVLGEVRDLDVLRASIEATLGLIDDDRIRTIVTSRLNHQGDVARDRHVLAKTTKRYASLVDEIATLATTSQFVDGLALHAVDALRPEMHRAWKEVTKRRRAARDKPTNEHLHRLRIELKRLQCACEVVGLIDTKHAPKVARAVTRAQTNLGVVHDEAVASAWLRALVVAEPRLHRPLDDITTAHEQARKKAKRAWPNDVAQVARQWDRWDL